MTVKDLLKILDTRTNLTVKTNDTLVAKEETAYSFSIRHKSILLKNVQEISLTDKSLVLVIDE